MRTRRAAMVLALGLLAAPLPSEAQPAGARPPRIGYLSGAADSPREAAFRRGLRDLGYVEGQNLVVEYRFADGHYEKLAGLAAELVRLDVAVIVAATTPAIRAAQQATRTIPIVMTLGEPAEASVGSLARPGGNTTGLSTTNTELGGKRLELLKEAVPRLSHLAVFRNPTNPISTGQVRSLEAASRTLGVHLQFFDVTGVADIEGAFAAAARSRADALMGLPDHVLGSPQQRRLAELALQHRMPTIYWTASHAAAGSLMGYGPDEAAMHHRAATYVDKLLKGARAAELPVEQPTKFVLVVNVKTAKSLGLTLPQGLLLRADRLIQ